MPITEDCATDGFAAGYDNDENDDSAYDFEPRARPSDYMYFFLFFFGKKICSFLVVLSNSNWRENPSAEEESSKQLLQFEKLSFTKQQVLLDASPQLDLEAEEEEEKTTTTFASEAAGGWRSSSSLEKVDSDEYVDYSYEEEEDTSRGVDN